MDVDERRNIECRLWYNSYVCLPEYMEAFEANNLMDFELLFELDKRDLSAMGVRKIGDQIKILKEIKKAKDENRHNRSNSGYNSSRYKSCADILYELFNIGKTLLKWKFS